MAVLTLSRTRARPVGLGLAFALALAGLMALPPILAVLAVLAVGGMLAVLARPLWGVLFLTVLLPVNNLVSEVLGRGALSTAFGAIKDAVLFLVLFAALQTGRVRSWYAGPAVVLAGVSLVGFAYADSLSGGLYGWRNDYEPVLLLIAVPAIVATREVAHRVLSWVVLAAQASAAVAIYTWTRGLPWLYTVHLLPSADGTFPFQLFSHNNSRPRAFSPFTGPNELSAYLDMSLAVILTRRDWSVRRRAVLCVLPIAAVYLARSRSGELGVALLFAVVAVRFARRVSSVAASGLAVMIGLTAVGALLYYLTAGSGLSGETVDPSLVGHASSLRAGVHNALTHPLGYGLGRVGPRALISNENPVLVESFWLLQALEAGALALLAYLVTVGRVAVRCVRAGGDAFLGVAVIASILVSQLVLPTMQDGPVSFTFWMLLGIAVVLRSEQETAPAVV